MSVDGFAFAEKVDWSIRFHWPWIPGNRSHTNPTQSFEGAQAKRRRTSVPSSVLSLMANPEISGHALQVERRKDDAMTGLGSLGTSMGLHSSEFCGIPCCWPWHPSLCVVGYLKVPASSTSTYLSSFIYVFPCNHISRRTRIYKTRTKLNPIDDDDDDDGRASW